MTYEDFNSFQFRKMKCKNNIPLNDEYTAYIDRKKNILHYVETCKDFEKYLTTYDKIKFSYLSEKQLDIIKKSNVKYKKDQYRQTYVYYFDEEYFKLFGKKYRNIRNSVNKYKDKITIKEKCNNITEVINLMKLWKKQRKDRYFLFITSSEEYFLNNYFNDKDFVSHFYYDNNNLIGYSIYERLENGLFNSFFRKSNLDYSHLSEFIDFKSFESVYKKYGNFYLNIGDDGGDKKIKQYKTSNFNISDSYNLYDITIENNLIKNNIKQII